MVVLLGLSQAARISTNRPASFRPTHPPMQRPMSTPLSSMAARDPGVLVLGGMHRSGTSLLASLFEAAGVSIGTRLLGSGTGNDAGHFEDLDFQEFHQQALVGNGLSAEGFTADALPRVPEPLHAEALRIVADRRRQGGLWGWKDPRTVLFLDFWAERLPDARYVFVFRRPWEVVDSFFRRGDPAFTFHPQLAVRVWLHYNRRILAFIQRHPEQCLIRETTQVATTPGELFAAIRDRFGMAVGDPPERYRPELLGGDADGRRARLLAASFPEAIDLYRVLCGLAGSDPPAVSETSLPASELAVQEWARAARLERENDEVRREWMKIRAAADVELAALRTRLASWVAAADDIQKAVHALAESRGIDRSFADRLSELRDREETPQARAA